MSPHIRRKLTAAQRWSVFAVVALLAGTATLVTLSRSGSSVDAAAIAPAPIASTSAVLLPGSGLAGSTSSSVDPTATGSTAAGARPSAGHPASASAPTGRSTAPASRSTAPAGPAAGANAASASTTVPVGPIAETALRTSLTFGATVQGSAGYEGSLEAFEARVGKSMEASRVYDDWDDAQPSPLMVGNRAHGRETVLSIKPVTEAGQLISWAAVANGSQDARIRAQAQGLHSYGAPVLLAFQHEADIAKGFGTAAQFVAAYRHYVTVFRQVGATNVQIGVIFTPVTFGRSIASWYPGDSWVSWIGTDAYNFGSCAPGVSGWRSLATAAQAFYSWGSQRGKPLVMAEWGSAEDPATPGRKASWITAAAQTLSAWPDIKVAIYFDHTGNCNWTLDTSASAFSSFAAAARSF